MLVLLRCRRRYFVRTSNGSNEARRAILEVLQVYITVTGINKQSGCVLLPLY